MTNKLYNLATWLWHKTLHHPITLKKVYDSGNSRAKVTVVFLHGISANSDTWRYTIKTLSQDDQLANVRFVTYDLLGFGRALKADWLSYNAQEYNSALAHSLARLKPHGVVIIVGHSMGSIIAANYVVHPVSAEQIMPVQLILVSPPVLMADELARLPDRVYTKSYSSLHKFASEVPAADVIAKLIQKFSSFRSNYLKSTAFAKSMENIILNRHNYQTFTKIHIPTTIIHGHFDPLVLRSNLKRAVQHNPHYLKYVSVLGHHDISVGKRAKILAEIKKVLRQESKP